MEILQVGGNCPDFKLLCRELEIFQFNMLPILKERGYSLTNNLDDIIGLVLYIDDMPVGSIGLKHISDDVCEIVRVFVCEKYRGNNYAKILFEKIENLARTMGYKKIEMVAWTKAISALKLYKKLHYNMSDEKISEWYGGNSYVELCKDL